MPTSQNEEHFWPQRTSSEGVVHTGYEECIFLSTFQSIVQEIPVFFHGGKSLWVSVPVFWAGPSPKNFLQIFKNSSINNEKNKHLIIYLDDMFLMGETLEEILIVIFYLQHLRNILNWEKFILKPVQEIKFLDLKV